MKKFLEIDFKKAVPQILEFSDSEDSKMDIAFETGDDAPIFKSDSVDNIIKNIENVKNASDGEWQYPDDNTKAPILDVSFEDVTQNFKKQQMNGSQSEALNPYSLFEANIKILACQIIHDADGNITKNYVLAISNSRGISKKLAINAEDYSAKAFSLILKKCPEFVFHSAVKNSSAVMRDHLTKILSDTVAYLPEQHIFKLSGWFNTGDEWRYLHGGMKHVESMRILPNVDDYSTAFSRFFKLSANFLRRGQEKENMLIFLHSHLGYLARLFKEAHFPAQYILFLKGKTNAGKTSLLSEISGEIMYEKRPLARLEDTRSYIEGVIAESQDRLILIDDAHPSPTIQGERDIKANIETVVRAYGDNQTRGKRGVDRTTLEKTEICGAVWLTGEYLHLAAQSSTLRVLEVELQENGVNRDTLNILQKNKNIAKEYYAGYVHYLEKNFKNLVEYFIDNQYEKRQKWREQINTDIARSVDIAVCLDFIGYTISKYAEWSLNDINGWYFVAENFIKEFLTKKVKKDKFSDPLLVFQKTLQALYDAGELKIAENKDVFRNNIEYIGYFENRIMYAINAKLNNSIKEKCKECGIAYLPPTLPALYDAGLVVSGKVSRFSLNRIDNTRPTMVGIFIDKVIVDK